MSAPPAYSTELPERTVRRGARQLRTIYRYRIVCPVCQKRFTRTKLGDNKLNNHKTPDGYRCPGSGGDGYPA
jgi:hypothetical protein